MDEGIIDEGRRRRLIEQRAAQGFPPTVEDPVALAKVAAIVLGLPDPPEPVSEDRKELFKLQDEIRAERNDLKRLRKSAAETAAEQIGYVHKIYELECEIERLRAELDAARGSE